VASGLLYVSPTTGSWLIVTSACCAWAPVASVVFTACADGWVASGVLAEVSSGVVVGSALVLVSVGAAAVCSAVG
jgi:hypothetical protein